MISASQSLTRNPELASELRSLLSPVSVIRTGESLARRTTFRVGGPADVFIEPASEQDLAAVLRYCKSNHLPILILGRGSNLLVKDQGFRGVVISLSQPVFSATTVDGFTLTCGAGVKLKSLAAIARQHTIGAFEFLEGIPGTVGGALRMNAGAMGGAIFDRVESVRCMGQDGSIVQLSPFDMGVAYRTCAALKSFVALSALFRGLADARELIDTRMKEFSEKRWATQPAAPSAGCIFKNPDRIAAGRLVDELGLKGLRIGGAVVSQDHANFIVTERNATAADVLQLIQTIQERAWTSRQIALETEVQIVGE